MNRSLTAEEFKNSPLQFIEALVANNRQGHDVGRVPFPVKVEQFFTDIDSQIFRVLLQRLDVTRPELVEVVLRVRQGVLDLKISAKVRFKWSFK